MKFNFWTLLCFVTFGIAGQYAQAKLTVASDVSNGSEDEIKLKTVPACRALLSLEDKENLSLSEEVVGLIAYDIVEQITESPLEYCSIMAGNIVEKDPL